MMDKLPEGWDINTIGEIASIVTKGTTPTTYGYKFINEGINFVKIENIKEGFIDRTSIEKFISKEAHESQKRSALEINDILFSIAGTIGTVAIVREEDLPANTNQALAIIRGYDGLVLPEFLKMVLTSQYLAKTLLKARGGALQNISLADIKNSQIPVPPVPEQKRLVSKLDNLFERIDQSVGLLEENIGYSDNLMASTLDEVFGTANAKWEFKKLQKITTKIGSGATPRGGQKSYKNAGLSLIRSMNVHDGEFKRKGLAFIDNNQAEKLSNVTIQKDDVLLNITGASVARCCTVDNSILPARVNQHVSIIRPNLTLNPFFLQLFLISPRTKSKLLFDSGGGATREAITKSMINNLEVPVPGSDEQKRIVEFVLNTKRKISLMRLKQQEKIDELYALKASTLNSAYKGML